MHEVSLMQSTLDLALDYAQRRGATQIHQFTMRVGQLSGVVPEALEFAFDMVVQNTIAQGARLSIEQVPARCHCATCEQDFQPDDWIYDCPHCHQISTDVRQGKELDLVSLEVS